MKWFLYTNQILSNGNYRLTYIELYPPPYGPGKPSINVCNRRIFEGKTPQEAEAKAKVELNI